MDDYEAVFEFFMTLYTSWPVLTTSNSRNILKLANSFITRAYEPVLILYFVTLVPSANFFIGNDFTWLWNWSLVGRCGRMNTEELELLSDSKYRNYVAAIDKALKNFEYSSEWADLISALGKLNKVCPFYPFHKKK